MTIINQIKKYIKTTNLTCMHPMIPITKDP